MEAKVRQPGVASPSAASPLIPLSAVDGPTQRVYLASAFLLLEAYKLYHLVNSCYSATSSWTLLGTFLLANLVFVTIASRLRVPRLSFGQARWLVIFLLLGSLDWTLCGGWRSAMGLLQYIPVLGWVTQSVVETWNGAFNREMSFSEHRVRLKDIIEPKHHIFGQHTIHILPYSTASLAPTSSTSSLASCFCLDLANAKSEITIPIRFNNTEPQYLSYSVTPFDEGREPVVYNITIPKGSLTPIGGHSEIREINKRREDRLDLELEDADRQRQRDGQVELALVRRGPQGVVQKSGSNSKNAKSQSPSQGVDRGLLFNLAVKQVGRVKLERVMDKNGYDARLSRSEILVVECPTMGFEQRKGLLSKMTGNAAHNCPKEEAILDLTVRGLAPLEVAYSRQIEEAGTRKEKDGLPLDSESFTISHVFGNSTMPTPLSYENERQERLTFLLSAKGATAQDSPSFEWAKAREVEIPVTVDLPRPGRYSYSLERVKDACGNVFQADSATALWKREVRVHPRRRVSFVGCDAKNPINLLQGGAKREVQVEVNSGASDEGPFHVLVRFQGTDEEWQRNVTISASRANLAIEKAGTYTLEAVQGRYCAGEVDRVWTCTAQQISPPTSHIAVDPIQDQCAGPVGAKALAILSGSPPFQLKYTITPKGGSTSTHERRIDRTREEIEFRPAADGEVTYTFVGLSDANYKDIKLDGPVFTQNFHPIAKASFVGSSNTQGAGPAVVLHSCEGNTSVADIQLEGVGPFEVSYAVRSIGGELAYTKTVKGVTTKKHALEIEVPPRVADKGGLLTVTLTSIKDAKGCARPLTTSDLTIDVRRTKPTIGFLDPRQTVMLDGGEARLPVRLAGEGPWKIRYRRLGARQASVQATISTTEGYLTVDKPGEYVLEGVTDLRCPGSVLSLRNSHVVSVRPRPGGLFVQDTHSQGGKDNVTFTRRPVCAGTPDTAPLRLEGHFPIQIGYRHRLPSTETQVERFKSAQSTTAIELDTGLPGQHVYELASIGDAIYGERPVPLKSSASRISQEVYALPGAAFISNGKETGLRGSNKMTSLCVGDSFSRQATGHGVGSATSLHLTGQTPFSLEFDIKDALGVTRKTIRRSQINAHHYDLEVSADEFVFDKTGKWSIEATRVQDGHGCERLLQSGASSLLESPVHAKHSTSSASLNLEVVETANISAVEMRSDHCVGETIEYVLQGTPPWTVVYDFEGVESHAPARLQTFSRVAEKPGTLQIKRIAHQQNKCLNHVEHQAGMIKTIHSLPTVYVKEGNHYVEDLRQGNQAEVVFKLQGVPPFSFSIQRTQAVDRVHKPIVLESHTVTGITESSYHLYTAEEGTWSVIWLRDRYCEVSLEASLPL